MGSIVASVGALVMILAFILFLTLNQKKETEITTISTELDSLNTVLSENISSLNPALEPIAYAIPTGRISKPGVFHEEKQLPEFQYFLCLVVVDSLKSKIKEVNYFMDHPTFRQKRYTSTTAADSFKVSYKGWGCLSKVDIYVKKFNIDSDTLVFQMCEKLQLKGFSIVP